ncbi:hypothetical protein [uncultured Robinsoniella sp.]|uniref:hypothetical protein n=1 Tax=uncultured Robinsoniella sp. TaxID=904190 RepID=UPI00374F89F8
MKLSKRIAIYVLCGTLCMGSVFGAYSQSVRASAVLPVAFAVEEVIGTVLSLLGIKFAWDAAGTAGENWDKYTEWAGGLREDILNTWQKTYDADIYKQLAKEFDKALDSGLTGLITISGNVWTALKDWADGVYNSLAVPGGSVELPAFTGVGGSAKLKASINQYRPTEYNALSINTTDNILRICGFVADQHITVFASLKESAYSDTNSYTNDLQGYYYLNGVKTGQTENGFTVDYRNSKYGIILASMSFYVYTFLSEYQHAFPLFKTNEEYMEYLSTGALPDSYVKPNISIGDADSSDLTTVDGVNKLYDRDKAIGAYDVLTPGRVIGNTGTVTGDVTVDTAREDAIAGVWAGDIPWVDFMDNIGAIPIDITTDLVIDKDDGASGDEKIEDKYTPPIAPPADMNSFTANLRGIFPFCIPFDLVDAFKVFTASKIAPVFSIPFKVPSLGVDQKWEIDMSKFESVIEIFRVMETIGFIVGLVLLTRNIIRG